MRGAGADISLRAMLYRRWILLCALAEGLGIAAAALWYGTVALTLGEPEALLPRFGVWFLLTLSAVPEGVILGGLQTVGVRWFEPRVARGPWIWATVTVGLIGWGIGSFIPMFLAADAPAEASAAGPGLSATLGFAAVFGLGVGLIFGAAQSIALPRGRMLWALANAAAWALALPMIYAGAQIAADLPGWAAKLALWAAGGIGAGLTIGAVTGLALLRLRRLGAASP